MCAAFAMCQKKLLIKSLRQAQKSAAANAALLLMQSARRLYGNAPRKSEKPAEKK